MRSRPLLPLALLLAPALLHGQSAPFTLPAGTPLPVSLPDHLPMKAGEPIRAQLMYPVYQDNKLVLPAHTVVGGTVVALKANRSKRIASRLRADFTPFHIPVVRFDSIIAPDGTATPISTVEGTDGAPVYRVVRTPAPKGGFLGQYWTIGLGYIDDTFQTIFGPNKGDRILQFIYSQLPYHPERIAKGTAWTVETSAPVSLSAVAAPPPVAEPKPSRFRLVRTRPLPPDAPAHARGERPTWILEAYLDEAISSETSKPAQAIHATVAEPVFNTDGSVAVPTGAVLTGTVTQARPARHFDRAGVLRFSFTEIKLPGEEEAQHVRTSLAAADSASGQIDMNSEGDVKPKAKDKIILPALLVIMASQPFDREHHGEGDHMAGKDATASSGMGLISLVVGTAANQPNFAIGLGMYSAALSVYPRYFGKGTAVAFPKDTRIVLQTTATRATTLKEATQ